MSNRPFSLTSSGGGTSLRKARSDSHRRRALSAFYLDETLISLTWRRPLKSCTDAEQDDVYFSAGAFPVEDLFFLSRKMWYAPCKKTLCVLSHSGLVHFLAFGQLRDNWSAWRPEKHSLFSAEDFSFWVGLFSLKTLHPHNGWLPAHCVHWRFHLVRLNTGSKTRVVVFVLIDFAAFDLQGEFFTRSGLSDFSFNHSLISRRLGQYQLRFTV